MRAPAALSGCLAAFSLMPGLALAGAQTFNTALPVAKGEGVLRGQFVALKRSDDSTESKREFTVMGGVAVLGYGMTGDLTLFGVLPYLHKELASRTRTGRRVERETQGLGDLRAFARYTLVHRDMAGRTLRLAPFAGIEAPTGDADERDRFGRLPQPLQLGSGSWDPFLGIVGTWQTLDYEVDAQVAYQANTEGAGGFEFGDVLHADASLQYRVWPRTLAPGVPGFLYGGLEANLIHAHKNELRGVADPNSGGTTLLLDPGLQYVTRRWVAEAAVQIPVLQDLNGTALEDDWTVRAGFRLNF